MKCKVMFLGAAQGVTGSQYLVETPSARVLVDCGIFQERRFTDRNWNPFSFDPKSVNAMLLTHAHLDHCGLIPRLAAQGFDAPIYCTDPTADIAGIVMMDSARLQEEDVRFKWKRHQKAGKTSPHPYQPLYTAEDAEAAFNLFRPVRFQEAFHVAGDIHAVYHPAGHILGAASILLTIRQDGEERTLLFSGDIGRHGMPIIPDPEPLDGADYVVMESTYGDRNHEDEATVPERMAEIINDTVRRGGNIVIPSFAVERAQDILYHLTGLRRKKKIPNLLVFLDSPMAIRVTEIFRRHEDYFDQETVDLLEQRIHPCDFPGLKLARTAQESKAINRIRGSVIIIAGSGMCTGGRIKHHLKANITREESTVLFVGYQSEGTLGRVILEKPKTVRIHGEEHLVRAKIEKINGFSGHAGREELKAWAGHFRKPPRRMFITHGELDAAKALKSLLEKDLGYSVTIPEYRQVVELD